MGFQESFETRVRSAADRAFGVSATLSHGGSTTDSFTVEWEDQKYDVMDAEGFLTQVHSRDFMFAVTAANISSVAFEPRPGDVLAVTENGVAKKFELLPVGSMPAIQLMPGGYRWKVHTKRVD